MPGNTRFASMIAGGFVSYGGTMGRMRWIDDIEPDDLIRQEASVGRGTRKMSRRKSLQVTAMAIFLMMFGSVAHAQWFTKSEEVDVFGDTPTQSTVRSSKGNFLAISCGGDEPIDFAYGFPDSKEDLDIISKLDPATRQVLLLVKVDSEEIRKFDAEIRRWNENYGAFVVTGRTPELAALIRSIGNAKQTIRIGVERAGGEKIASDSFGVIGSKSAAMAVIKNCHVDQIEGTDGDQR